MPIEGAFPSLRSQNTPSGARRSDDRGRSGVNQPRIPLGNTTVCATNPQKSHKKHHFNKWDLLNTARKHVPGHENRNGHHVPDRVFYCQTKQPRARGGKVGAIPVFQATDPAVDAAFYGNLFCCGSVWGCPVCSPRISEVRAHEVGDAMDRHYAAGGICLMITLTIPHRRDDRLKGLLDQFLKTIRRFKSGGDWTRLKTAIGFIGGIRGLETTYGVNGWHPHIHEVLFVASIAHWRAFDRISDLEDHLSDRWRAFVRDHGFGETNDHGLKLELATASGYIAKFGDPTAWGADREIARGISKQSSGMSPWDLLDRAGSDSFYGNLWKEYYEAFRGKRQLVWSRGLRETVFPELKERTDQQIAAEIPDGFVEVGSLSESEWNWIQSRGTQGAFLYDVVEVGFTKAKEQLHLWMRSRTPT